MSSYKHVFTGAPPEIRWCLIRTQPAPFEIIATGTSETQDQAWDDSMAALPPLSPSDTWDNPNPSQTIL